MAIALLMLLSRDFASSMYFLFSSPRCQRILKIWWCDSVMMSIFLTTVFNSTRRLFSGDVGAHGDGRSFLRSMTVSRSRCLVRPRVVVLLSARARLGYCERLCPEMEVVISADFPIRRLFASALFCIGLLPLLRVFPSPLFGWKVAPNFEMLVPHIVALPVYPVLDLPDQRDEGSFEVAHLQVEDRLLVHVL